MLFSNTLQNLPGQLFLNHNPIARVNSSKFLGLHIDEHLSWNEHLSHLNKHIARNAGVIYKLRSIFPQRILLMLYNTLILPHLNYGILAWGSSPKSQIEKILITQKRILRNIFCTSTREHTDPLFFESKILKIDDIFNLSLGSMMFKLNKNELPPVLELLFKKNNEVHKYPTRQTNLYHLPKTRLKLLQDTVIYCGPKLWNSLSPELKTIPSFFYL